MGTNEWQPIDVAPISWLADLWAVVLEAGGGKRSPKWRFRIAADAVLQMQARAPGRQPWRLAFEAVAVFGAGADAAWLVKRPAGESRGCEFWLYADAAEPGAWHVRARSFSLDRETRAPMAEWPTRVLEALDTLRTVGLSPGLMLEPNCLRCGRALTDPASMARWIGPECAGSSSVLVPRILALTGGAGQVAIERAPLAPRPTRVITPARLGSAVEPQPDWPYRRLADLPFRARPRRTLLGGQDGERLLVAVEATLFRAEDRPTRATFYDVEPMWGGIRRRERWLWRVTVGWDRERHPVFPLGVTTAEGPERGRGVSSSTEPWPQTVRIAFGWGLMEIPPNLPASGRGRVAALPMLEAFEAEWRAYVARTGVVELLNAHAEYVALHRDGVPVPEPPELSAEDKRHALADYRCATCGAADEAFWRPKHSWSDERTGWLCRACAQVVKDARLREREAERERRNARPRWARARVNGRWFWVAWPTLNAMFDTWHEPAVAPVMLGSGFADTEVEAETRARAAAGPEAEQQSAGTASSCYRELRRRASKAEASR